MTFWDSLQTLVDDCEIVIDRPRHSVHPRFPDYVYPFDYEYLDDTTSGDGDGIDCWKGSLKNSKITGVVLIVDPVKRDSEVKILLGCSPSDMGKILNCHKRGSMDALLIKK